MEVNIVDKYEKLEKVGEGTYGKVYKAQDRATGQLVALKKTRLEMDEEGIPPTALREISLLNLLSHSVYVVRLLAVEQAAKNGKPVLYLVFEFLDTDLKKYLDAYRRGPNARPLPTHLVKVNHPVLYRFAPAPTPKRSVTSSASCEIKYGFHICSLY
jgi:cyclin-dependent kinase